MGKSVKIIGKKKWVSLSPRQKHTAISKFAVYCINEDGFDDFLAHYEKLISWTPIDRFFPPEWTTKKEKLELFFSFHQKLSSKPIHYFRDVQNKDTDLTWIPKYNISIILDQVLTPYNVGSVLRIIDNFGFSKLIHSTKNFNFSNSNFKRTAMGSENWIPINYEENLSNYIKNCKTSTIGLEKTKNSIPITEWKIPDLPFNIVVGNEAYGISGNILDHCTECVHIPMTGYKNSMNLSHAFAIISFYITLKYKKMI